MLPRPRVSQAGQAALTDILEREVSAHRIPATFIGATNADGELFWARAGEKEFGNPQLGIVDDDTLLQLFSMTKLITSVALLQLCDRGLASLDDPELLDKYIPEIASQDVLVAYNDDGPVYAPRKKRLTLRMLLSHTSGLCHARRNTMAQRWQREHGAGIPGQGVKEWLGPLCFEPQTRWRYGTGVDWAGFLLERVTGKKLGEWMEENIFRPLGITSMTFEPSLEAQARLMTMTLRDGGNSPIYLPPPGMRPQHGWDGRKRNMGDRGAQNGGGGLYGTARDYLRFLRGVLAARDAPEGQGLISRKMWNELFTSSLPPRGPDNKCYADCAKSMLFGTFTDPAHTDNGGQGLAHSVGFMLNTMDSVHGRKAGSGCWDVDNDMQLTVSRTEADGQGAAHSEYWIDPASGIAAVFATNLTSPNPDRFMEVYNEFERTLYDSLEVCDAPLRSHL